MEERIPAIPTTYNGINFRSRLEAKWARFFDMAGWRYEYEPEDFDGYIPDFVLLFKEKLYVEVKPIYSYQEAWDKCQKAKRVVDDSDSDDMRVLCLGGTIGYVDDKEAENQCRGSGFVLGWCFGGYTDQSVEGHWSSLFAAEMIVCGECESLSFFLPKGWWGCAVCGCHWKHYWKAKNEAQVICDQATRLWKSALNETQYFHERQKGVSSFIAKLQKDEAERKQQEERNRAAILAAILKSEAKRK